MRKPFQNLSACQATAMTFGALAGLGGLTHGVGEVLQGNRPVEGLAIDSWTTGPIAEHMGGEPGLTLLPTASSAGLATLGMSAAVVTWALLGTRRPHGGPVLAGLSLGMLLCGGGVGPPVIGMLAGAIGRWGPARQPRRVRRLSPDTRRRMARTWPVLFPVSLANGAFLVLGSLLLVHSIGFHAPKVFESSFYLSVVMLLAALWVAPAHDAQNAALRQSGMTTTPLAVGATSPPDVPSPSGRG